MTVPTKKTQPKPGRGGYRPGAGRPRGPDATRKTPVSISLERWIVDAIDARPGTRTEVIKEAIEAHYPEFATTAENMNK